jgi:hypothetical protein
MASRLHHNASASPARLHMGVIDPPSLQTAGRHRMSEPRFADPAVWNASNRDIASLLFTPAVR